MTEKTNKPEESKAKSPNLFARTAIPLQFCGRLIKQKWTQLAIVVSALTIAALVIGAPSPPSIPALNLSNDPLFAAGTGDKPVMALALSVEFPTVGAQYTLDDYSNENEYLGYYDAESCYNYNNAPTETPASGLTATDYKRFDRVSAAIALTTADTNQPTKTSRKCANAFSGNYLNWASNSGIDMLRLALSGGDRYIDEVGLTVLQRAVLPNGDPRCFWNTSNFPAKQLRKDGGGVGTYFGAIPTAMITAAAGNDVWAANTLNRIYFSTSNSGSCTNTANHKLGSGTPAVAKQVGTPVVDRYATASTGQAAFVGGSVCANEGGVCDFAGVKEVLYGSADSGGNPGGWITFPASGGINCTNNMTGSFRDPAPRVGKKCFIRDYAGPWQPTAGVDGLNNDGFFYSRVQVCNAVSGVLQDVRDYAMCTRYGSNFKPTGAIQKYSEQLRLASFGYLMDPTASYNTGGRFGGVLRVPVKYVGAKTFDINGSENTPGTGNPNAEWDKATGIFYTNPDGDTTQTPPISGNINFLNKFGRTGPVPGRYKTYDPVGELYYQTLRYLQGLPPSADAISNITTDMYDGFPLSTTWTDPYGGGRSSTADYSCLKSNIVVVGDVNTHDGNRMPAANLSGNIPNFGTWTSLVRNFENNNPVTYTDGQGASRTAGNPNTANPSAPGNIVPGAAYWARTQDIRGTAWTDEPTKQRPGLRVKSFFFDVNEYSNSTNADYRRNQNQFFMGAKYGGFETNPSNRDRAPFNTFGNPFKRQDGTNDNNVWQDPANPGEAASFYLQSSARGVLASFDKIFGNAGSQANSIAGLAVTSSKVTGQNLVYSAGFNTNDWSGNVSAFPVTVSSTGTVAIDTVATWNAAERLGALASPATTRNIIVGRVGATTAPNATLFTWADILDDTLKVNLGKSTPSAATDTLGQDRLNYLRGDRTKEGNPFRVRGSLLGDVVNSGIVYSGTPTAVINGGSSFATFRAAAAGRTPAVFAGANDGMLHAFNANTGDELFAYIPSWMGPKLSALAAPSFVNNHQAYVDATPVVASAKVGSSWKTVLVSGTGAGGRGVFALDVTSPSSFGVNDVMWEFTPADDADIGFVLGKPQLVKLRTSAPGVSPVVFKWFAAVASGANNYVPDNENVFSVTGKPALFLLDLSKSAGSSWVLNSNYYKLSLPNDSVLDLTSPTGLINFTTLTGLEDEVRSIYMGDLHGKLWKLDFTLAGEANWNFNFLSFKKSGSAIPMFIAKTPTGAVQQITAGPTVLRGPRTVDGDTFYVTFGTGKYIEPSDKTSTTQHSAYAIYDNGVVTSVNPAGDPLISGRGRLKQLTLNTTTGVISAGAFTWGRAASDGDTTQRSGWYLDFTVSGERQVFNGQDVFGKLIFGTVIPASAGTAGSCAALGGSGRIYTIDPLSGRGSYEEVVGIPGQRVFLGVDDVPERISDPTGRRIVKRIAPSIQGTNLDNRGSAAHFESVIAGRLSWRQINNYHERKNAP